LRRRVPGAKLRPNVNEETPSMHPTRWVRLLWIPMLAGCAAAPARVPAADAPTRGSAPAALAPPRPIDASEYAARRARLAEGMADGVLLVLGAGEPRADYLTFDQNTDFRYLTGIMEPGAALVITRRGDAVSTRLFVEPRDPSREVWEGIRLGVEGAKARSGLATSPAADLLPALDSLLRDGGKLYTPAPTNASDDPLATLGPEQQVTRALAARHPGVHIVSLSREIQRMRAAKSPAEIDRIRRAVTITALAQRAAMRAAEPGMNEFELQGLIEYTFRRNGAERPSFATIVGSGPNSTALHYNSDDRFMTAGDVVVMDIGASYEGYAADVTRTIPVSGTFSPEQRALYEVVLEAQKAAESRARAGASWRELNDAAEEVLARGLTRLGLIESPEAVYHCEARAGTGLCPQLRLFYMHGLGHGIGLDVHDPEISYTGPFRVGSVFTIEPGLYIRAQVLDELASVPENRDLMARIRPVVERFRGIGVRIEDDYLITATGGVERLSVNAPREIGEIEALMRLPPSPISERNSEIVEWYRSLGQN
jgi:Xaa-Pro aminopeptidase